ncbi:MAG TPA: prolipoprotein diacylglyceryl transferase family protein [Candidatus Limnocylindrales bacterium]|nr:prolipoprotein diacylglyceryl transferase family protein [Candidatus Limnocylindrales bacterium]
MPPALIELAFDPLLHIGQLTIRWQTIGVTVALLAALAIAALMAPDVRAQRPFFRRRRPDLQPHFPSAPQVDHTGTDASGRRLRLDDMLLIIAGVVPGAVIGGRIVHGLVFFDAYAGQPQKLFDPLVGTLSLLGAVLGGLLSAAYVARLLGAPVRRWADAAAVPLLLALGLGKLSQLLGGSGQGLPFDGSWAVAFVGGGPWVSLSADVPSHPAQVYEGLWLLVGIAIVLLLAGRRHAPVRANPLVAWADRAGPPGRLFALALSWFLVGRVVVGFTWRDERLVGPLNAEQALALVVLIATGLGYWLARRRGKTPAPTGAA